MKLIFSITIIILSSKGIFGQAIISGIVQDKRGEPLLGVNVYLQGTYDGASTNADGHFSFDSEKVGVQSVIASYIGYKTYYTQLDLNNQTTDLIVVLEEEINKIDGITVTAGAFEASDKKKSVVLTTFDIVTTAGATADITGVMNTLPGTQTVGEEGRLFVRGGAGHEAKTFINGLLVAEPYNSTATNIPSRFRFSPFLFKGAFFSTGGYSAEYGQALSSVLQLKTYDLPIRSQTDISLMSVGGDISQTIRKNNTSIYGQLQYTNLSPYFVAVPQKYMWEKPPNSFNATLHFKQKFKKTGNIQAYSNYDKSAMSMHQPAPGSIHEQVKHDIRTQNFYTNVAMQNSINKSISYRGGISYSKNINHLANEAYQSKVNTQSLHAKVAFDHDVAEKVLFKYGGEWIYDGYDELLFGQENIEANDYSFENHIMSSFVETSVYFTNNFMARIGVRYDYADLIHISEFSPRASLAYKLNNSSQVSMAYGKFAQLPIRDYLKLSTTLNVEHAAHYILNYQYRNEGRIFRSEVFYKKYDQLVTNHSTDAKNFRLENNGYGDAKGVDMFWRDGKTLGNADYWISYSYLDTERLYDIFPYPVMPYYASRHNLSVVYKQFITGIKSQIGWTYSFASGRPYTDPNTGEYNSRMTRPYYDLSINYTYLIKSNLILHASISNLPGFKNIFGYQYDSERNGEGVYESIAIEPQAKRFMFIGIFLTISKDGEANQLNNL